MIIHVFGSSSAGNCIYVGGLNGGPGVFIDAGIHPKIINESPYKITNSHVLITHEHGDHAKYASELASRYGCNIYGSDGTLKALDILGRRKITVDQSKYLGWKNFRAIPFPVVHYPAAEPVGWLIDIDGERLLYMTDLGQLPNHKFPKCDVYFIEANYTPKQLDENIRNGTTPALVAGRTGSGFGHIGIEQAIEFITPRLDHAKLVILGHMSKANFNYMEAYNLMPQEMSLITGYAHPGQTYNTIPF